MPGATGVAAELSAVGVDLAWAPVEPGPGDPFFSAASGRTDAAGGVAGNPRVGWVAVLSSGTDGAAFGEARARELSDLLAGEGYWTWYGWHRCAQTFDLRTADPGRVETVVVYATGHPDQAARDAAAAEREALRVATNAALAGTTPWSSCPLPTASSLTLGPALEDPGAR